MSAPTATPDKIAASIFRAYDIRGIVDDTLTETTTFAIGQALGTSALEQGQTSMITGRDGRLSGPRLMDALQRGILSTGCDVIDIGMVPSPVLYFATHTLSTQSGAMLTGSHNPVNYNGIKMVIAGETLTEQAIQQLYQRICAGDFRQGQGTLTTTDVQEAYLERITSDVTLKRPLKVVLDAGNGVAGPLAKTLFTRLGCDVTPLYCDIDGNFPGHHPDPSKAENLVELINTVKAQGADIGLALDGDGDRLGVVTSSGDIIWPDRQMMLYAKAILAKHPGETIVFDVKCSKNLADIITAAGGVPCMYKTGHSLLKNQMKVVKAPLAGEMSGHIFYKDRWYGFDDGTYTGVRLLEIVADQGQSVDALFAEIPNSIATPEINVTVPEAEKFNLVAALRDQSHPPEAKAVTIDGLRLEFPDGWGLVRASNTTPCLVVRFEADSEQALKRIQDYFQQLFAQVGLDRIEGITSN